MTERSEFDDAFLDEAHAKRTTGRSEFNEALLSAAHAERTDEFYTWLRGVCTRARAGMSEEFKGLIPEINTPTTEEDHALEETHR